MIPQMESSDINVELGDNIQNWIINCPNFIDSPDRNDILKFG